MKGRHIVMKLQKLYRYVRQATDEYNLIEDGDKIAVAVSGGKDSLALLYALAGLKRFYPASFTICAYSALTFSGDLIFTLPPNPNTQL